MSDREIALTQELGKTGGVVGVHKAHPCARMVAVVLFMIDNSDSSRDKPANPAGDAGMEEARLRQQAIGVKLRHMFDQVVNEPVPDEFLDILRRADDKSNGGNNG